MSEQTPPEGTDPSTQPAAPKTESHDPAVPAAYAAFMRTGWGDREQIGRASL